MYTSVPCICLLYSEKSTNETCIASRCRWYDLNSLYHITLSRIVCPYYKLKTSEVFNIFSSSYIANTKTNIISCCELKISDKRFHTCKVCEKLNRTKDIYYWNNTYRTNDIHNSETNSFIHLACNFVPFGCCKN